MDLGVRGIMDLGVGGGAVVFSEESQRPRVPSKLKYRDFLTVFIWE